MELFPFVPQKKHKSTLEWKTDVIRAKSKEQRISLREDPRMAWEYQYILNEQQFVRARLLARGQHVVLVPLWDNHQYVGAVTSGTTVLSVDTTQAYYAEQLVVWENDSTFEVIDILSITDNSITLSSAVTDDYTAAIIMPVRECWFMQFLDAQRYLETYTQISAQFVTTDGQQISLPFEMTMYPITDAAVYLDCNVALSETVAESYGRESHEFDTETGILWKSDSINYPIRISTLNWFTNNKTALWELQTWLHGLRGRWKTFWLPSWNNDMILLADISINDDILAIEDIGYFENIVEDRFAMITTKVGGRHYVRIIDSQKAVDGHDLIKVDPPMSVAISVSDVEQISFLTMMRLSADRIEIRHESASTAIVSIPVMEVDFVVP